MLVMVDSLLPGIGNQYAALAAWDAQLMDEPIDGDRPVNLFRPADSDSDHGAHGIFDGEAGGVPDPSFLRSLPRTARLFAEAVRREARDRHRQPALAGAGRTPRDSPGVRR